MPKPIAEMAEYVAMRNLESLMRTMLRLGIVPESSAIRSKQNMKLHVIELNEEWALRNLMICVRSLKDLPIYAQELVKQLMPV